MEESKELSFEVALGQLEELVAKMESGRLPLADMISEFERGSKLVNLCRGQLDTMQRKIEILTRDDGQKGQWSNFESN